MNLRQMCQTAIAIFLLLTVITGGIYPVVMTGIAKLCFPEQASGSLITANGRIMGSRFIGQPFLSRDYFWGRPSATADFADNALASGGSQLGPTNPQLAQTLQQRVAQLRLANPGSDELIPVDLVTSSGSGLDPDISVSAARYQVNRVALARNLTRETVLKLIDTLTIAPTLGFWGEARVNVLALNLALDKLKEENNIA